VAFQIKTKINGPAKMLKKFTFLNDFFPTKKYTSHALKLYSEMFIFPNNTPFLPLKKNVILKAIQA